MICLRTLVGFGYFESLATIFRSSLWMGLFVFTGEALFQALYSLGLFQQKRRVSTTLRVPKKPRVPKIRRAPRDLVKEQEVSFFVRTILILTGTHSTGIDTGLCANDFQGQVHRLHPENSKSSARVRKLRKRRGPCDSYSQDLRWTALSESPEPSVDQLLVV
jgi:hypothetical protein